MPTVLNHEHICPRCRHPRESWMALGPDVEVSLGDPIPLGAHRRQCRDRCDQCFLIMRGRIIRHVLGFLWMVRDETIWPID